MLFPKSTNADYHGAPLAAWFLVLAGVLTLVPGCIHYFLPDGGAGVIAGIDLTNRGDTIIALFSWYGAMQIPQGLAQIIVGLMYRTLTPLFLALLLVERALTTYDGFFWKGAVSGHHPPEHYASIAAVVLGGIFFALSLRPAGNR